MAKCAIAGATGLVGSHLLPLLLRDYASVAAVTRRPLAVSGASHLLETGFGEDFESGLDAAYCCLGTTIRRAGSQEAFRKVDFDAIVDFARRAKSAGARYFALVSSVGADSASATFYLRVKGETERAVSELGFDGVYLFRPSFLTGRRSESRAGEKFGIVVSSAISFVLAGPLARYHAIDASKVAQAMLAAVHGRRAGTHVIEYREILRLCEPS